MSVLTKNLLVVLSFLLFVFTAVADVPPPQNAERRDGVSFSVHDVKKELTPVGWAAVVSGLALAGYGIFRFVKRPRIK
jgi:hypothetical protein